MAAPEFMLPTPCGRIYRLADFLGHKVLLSFLRTKNPVSRAPDRSRSQIIFLKSMNQQYAAQGLRVAIVDATPLASGSASPTSELINFTYDWDPKTIPVLQDEDASTARHYGVKVTPTTFLIGRDGIVQQRWNGLVTSGQLALALKLPPTGQAKTGTGCLHTPAQARFAGMPLARPLSPYLWVVDAGLPWSTTQPTPLRWIALSQAHDLRLRVWGLAPRFPEPRLRLDQPMRSLPTEEAQGLLAGSVASDLGISMLASKVQLPAGLQCMEVEALLARQTSNATLQSGKARIPVH